MRKKDFQRGGATYRHEGLYLHHHIRMPRINVSRTVEDNSVEVGVTASQYLEMASKVLTHSGARIRDRSIIMTIIQTAMDESTAAKVFNYVAFPQLSKFFGTEDFTRWDESKAPVRLDLVRPKTNYRYYTFLGRDGVMLLREYLVSRTRAHGRIVTYAPSRPKDFPRSDPIYLNKYGKPITPGYIGEIFREAGKLAGVNVSPQTKLAKYQGATMRYPFHAHQARDTLITLRQKARVDRAVVDFFAGHKFDDDAYDSPWENPDLFREEYKKVERYLNLLSGAEERIRDEVEQDYRVKFEEIKKNQAKILELLKKGAKVDPRLFDLKDEDVKQ